MHDRIFVSLVLMLSDYRPGAKSRHWERFFTEETIDALRDENKLAGFRSNDLKNDLEDRASWFSTADAYKRLAKITGPEWIETYAETSIGNPKTVSIGGHAINFHELVLCQYLWTISEAASPATIVEIGGGYGGLAHKLKKRFPTSHYVSLDLPEALTLQAYYLSWLYPQAKFYLFDDYVDGKPIEPERYDFTLLPGWFAPKLREKSTDLFINTRSFMEMNRDVIADYFHLIQRSLKTDGLFYNVNRYFKDTVGEPIRFRDYPYDNLWKVQFSRPSFFQPHVHEMMTVRTDIQSEAVQSALAILPENSKMHKPTKKHSLIEKLALLPMVLRR